MVSLKTPSITLLLISSLVQLRAVSCTGVGSLVKEIVMTTETLITKKITYTFQELADLVAKTNGIVYTGEPHVVFRDDDTCVFEFRKEQVFPVVPDKDGWIPWEAGKLNIAPKELKPYDAVDYTLRDKRSGRDKVCDLFWCEGGSLTIIRYRKA
jgi:hypothetical protein